MTVDVKTAELIDAAARAIGQPGIPALVARAEVHSHPRVFQLDGGPASVHLGMINLSVTPALAMRYAAELIVIVKEAMEINRARTLASLAQETEPELAEPCCDKHRSRADHVGDEQVLGEIAWPPDGALGKVCEDAPAGTGGTHSEGNDGACKWCGTKLSDD